MTHIEGISATSFEHSRPISFLRRDKGHDKDEDEDEEVDDDEETESESNLDPTSNCLC